jgi:predicted amidohydrolase
MRSVADHAANFGVIESLAREARRRGAAMLFLPENALSMGATGVDAAGWPAASVPFAPGAPPEGWVARLCELARAMSLYLSVCVHTQAHDAPAVPAAAGAPPRRWVRNTQLVIDAAGAVIAAYHKAHLFHFSNGDVRVGERESTLAGDVPAVVVDTPVGRLGLATCYDLRFPLLFAALRAAGAEAFSLPSAFTVPTGAAHWEPLLRARAIETQAWAFAAAQGGRHPGSARASYGHAMVVDPWGAVVAQASDDDLVAVAGEGMGEGGGGAPAATADERVLSAACASLLVVSVDRARVAAVRRALPVGEHARPWDWYRPSALDA